MDVQKIGKFIAQFRKEQNLTQEQFGEKIGVTNKTVSRWETGVYLPPTDVLVLMSEMFSVSINEILSGGRLEKSEYQAAAEENLKGTLKSSVYTPKEKIQYFKGKWLKEHIAFMIMLGLIVLTVFVIGLLLKSGLVLSISVLLAAVFHGIRNNIMMSYIEKHIFDENTSNGKTKR